MLTFNEDRDVLPSHDDSALARVLHVFDCDWHGIRAATACLPGGKLGISHKEAFSAEELRHIEGLIYHHGFTALCYQGFSEHADQLAGILHRNFGAELRQYVITHVGIPQFEHAFELHMLRRIYTRLDKGVIARVGSVRPNFHAFLEQTWPRCVINIPPNLARLRLALPECEQGTVFIPVENTWRKNLYAQVIAAQKSSLVERILLINWPSHLEEFFELDKVHQVQFQKLSGLLSFMRLSEVVCNVSLLECQPMTQLEALSVGTPSLVNALHVPAFSQHPLSRFSEVEDPTDPDAIRAKLDALVAERRADPKGLAEMIASFVQLRIAAGLDSYREFLEV